MTGLEWRVRSGMKWDEMGWDSGVIAERGKSVLAREIHPEF